ncbi:23S rRNA (pseudouridine(1915)-N(3))-methyltransferase RlmH [Canibacter oris]|uniref:Ribosomal RNA large subunit methyltransferase H n=1 Tax=Canibacter oris TaxID=1365628 RepID=A0A840DC52_9MICO|nr:23S rRNA (pseudouridine(1915)-N(3))-methyltransferase RlmH [Canibacter oris]MBB4071051.1 23S rRNA (pseudouridine1915-N3)-methyltransferase [Canibacter oris]
MTLRILAVGKKHESWVAEGIGRYEKRLRKPWQVQWQLLPHSAQQEEQARTEESTRILGKLQDAEFVVLLDERGKMLSSPKLAQTLEQQLQRRNATVIIGGAYGVDERVRQRADLVWSLSDLVFPHQLVRLILVEQIYRAGEIAAGRPYHHV